MYPRSFTSVNAQESLNVTDEDGKALLTPSDNNACVNKFFEDKFFEEIYEHLTPKQRDVIDAVYRYNMSLATYGKEQGITYTGAYLLEKRALELLRKVLANKEV